MTKAEIVKEGRVLGVPFERTWSCYQAEESACGACESCVLRSGGFAAGAGGGPDPYPRPPGRETLVTPLREEQP